MTSVGMLGFVKVNDVEVMTKDTGNQQRVPAHGFPNINSFCLETAVKELFLQSLTRIGGN